MSTAGANKVYVADGAGSGSWKYAGTPVYGSIYSKDGSIAISTIGITAKKLEAFTANGPYSNTTPAHGSDQITVTVAGDYFVSFSSSMATAAAGDAGVYQCHLRVNGTENAAMGVRHDFVGTADMGSLDFSGIVTLAANDVLTVYIESDSGADTDDVVVHAASLSVFLLKAS